jgi:hypothetical protein
MCSKVLYVMCVHVCHMQRDSPILHCFHITIELSFHGWRISTSISGATSVAQPLDIGVDIRHEHQWVYPTES